MTSVIRFVWVGGRRTERRCAAVGMTAVALAATVGILGIGGEHAASAQDASTPSCRAGLRAGSMVANGEDGSLAFGAHQLRFCGERGRVTYTMSGAPHVYEFTSTLTHLSPSIMEALSDWHDWFLYDRLCKEVPVASDLPGAKLTIRLISYVSTTDVSITITLSPDTEKPTLTTTSTPPKGSKVSPGDTIKVRMEASEEYGENRHGWQTGVKKIQLIDESRSQVVTPHFENSGPPRPCQQKRWKQWLEITYRVPSDPPPIIRLRAIAEDFAGNKDFDIAEFPVERKKPQDADKPRDADQPRDAGRQRSPCRQEKKIVHGLDVTWFCP